LKTTIEFRDGKSETAIDIAPLIDMVERKVCGVNDEGDAVTEDVPLKLVKKITFEPQDN